MNDNLIRLLSLAIESMLEAFKALNTQLNINKTLETLIMNDQEAQDQMNMIVEKISSMQAVVNTVSMNLSETQSEVTVKLAELQETINAMLSQSPGLSPELVALIDAAAVQTEGVANTLVQVQAASQALADIIPDPVEEPAA
jgi:hypothetical protein